MKKLWVKMVCLALLGTSMAGCLRYRDYVYFRNLEATAPINDTTAVRPLPENAAANFLIKIQPFDNIDIKVLPNTVSFEKVGEGGTPLSGGATGAAGAAGATGGTMMVGYKVDELGEINFPMLGRIRVSGLTIKEAEKLFTDSLSKYLVDPYVRINFLSFRIYVLGEVRTPGVRMIPTEKASIVEALMQSGDLTDFADRQHIKVIRGYETPYMQVFELDITSGDIFKSRGYYLQPNDMVYVAPLRRKLIMTNYATVTAVAASLTLLVSFTQMYFIIRSAQSR